MERQRDARLVELAESQWGVVTRAQLCALGLGASGIDARLRRGALRRLHRGVYALGHAALRDEGRWLAATLACGSGAVLSHLSAAQLWGMRVPRQVTAVHVIAPRHRRGDAGLVVHRARRLEAVDVTARWGIPVTTPARTLIDAADELSYEELRALADRGVRLDVGAVRRAQARAPGRRGAPRVRRLLGADGGELRSRSRLERRLRALCRAGALPLPRVNERVAGRERDAVWPAHRLVVEVDGGQFHAPRPAREDDHGRDLALTLAGWRVARFTDHQVFHEGAGVVAAIKALLAGGASPDRARHTVR